MESVKGGDGTASGSLNRYGPAALLILSLLFFLVSVTKGWDGTLCELHGFRQTQTAITVSYLLKGGPWIAYETPVLGPPWAIPFEFPLYQWIVALLVKAGLFPIDQSGRFVSVIFFLSTLYPLFKILEALNLTKNQRFLVLSLYCLSPEYIYWSRTFMIESMALALAVCYLWLVVLYFNSRTRMKWFFLIWLGIVGSLAGIVKITTFFAFVVSALIFCGWYVLRGIKDKYNSKLFISMAVFLIFAVVIPFIAVSLWTSYSDSLKQLNPIAKTLLTSSGLKKWNFGTFSQKLSLVTWKMFYSRILPDIVGSSWLAIVSLLALFMCRRDRLKLAFASLFLFVLPLAVFTNLHYVHNYYAYANGIFLVVAIGIISVDLWESGNYFKRISGILLFCLTVFLSTSFYLKWYWPIQGSGYNFSDAKKDIERYTKEDDVIVVFGADWSSEIPYYLQRRAIMIPGWFQGNLNESSYKIIKQNLEEDRVRVGAVLFAYGEKYDLPFIHSVLSEFKLQDSYMLRQYRHVTVYYGIR